MINEYITSYHLPQLAEAIRIYVDSKTNEIKSTTDLICVTYEELVTLRNDSLLKPGCFYCITDYVTTTGVANTESAGYNFPIIVLATSSNKLSEEAVTTNFGAHSYFENSNLDAWKIWYCLDNDDDRFSWAGQKLRKTCFAFQLSSTEWFSFERDKSLERLIDNTTYYGYKWESGFVQTDTFNDATILWYNVEYPELTIIYERVDTPVYIENNGNLSEMTLSGYFEEIDSGKIGKGVIYRMIDEFGNDCPYDFKNIKFKNPHDENDDNYYYTFTKAVDGNNISDASVNPYVCAKANIIGSRYENSDKMMLPINIFCGRNVNILNNVLGNNCYDNMFGEKTSDNYYCQNNTFGNECYNNSFGNNCYSNTFGYNCPNNTFGNECHNNSFGNTCFSNTFGNNCYSNTFGYTCYSNTFGNDCYSNTFGYNCYSNTFRNFSDSNSFGNNCNGNSFGNDCQYNSFGNYCNSNTFGGRCNSNSFGNNCQYNSFGNNCQYNSFGNYCRYNSFRNGASETDTLKNYCNYNHFDDGCSYNVIWNSDTTSTTINLKNVNVNRGVSGARNSYNTINIDILNSENEINVNNVNDYIYVIDGTENIYNTTYENLLSLRDNNQLIAGMSYRIIDYVTTTSQENTSSAGHPFDVIVLALSDNTLSEEAQAIQNNNDGYFDSSNLGAWKIWYSLDNDTSICEWTDTTNGKGVIYRMIDEFNNDCPYDFKNILFKRKLTNGVLDVENGVDTWCYTFNAYCIDEANIYDASVISRKEIIRRDANRCYGNIIKEYSVKINNGGSTLNDIVFLNIYGIESMVSFHCSDNSLGNSCSSNTFGNSCSSNTFGSYCGSNYFGNSCSDNSFGNSCSSNTFGSYCGSNYFGNSCSDNSFGNECVSNSFGNSYSDNSFGNSCSSNTFGNNCYYNTFGNSCSDNSFGNNCNGNSFGNYCYYNSFGNSCDYNSFRNSASQTGALKNYCNYNHFDDGCSYNVIWNSDTTSSSIKLKNVNINRGVSGTSSSFNTINIDTLNQDYEIQVAKNSNGEIKIYCEADLIP